MISISKMLHRLQLAVRITTCSRITSHIAGPARRGGSSIDKHGFRAKSTTSTTSVSGSIKRAVLDICVLILPPSLYPALLTCLPLPRFCSQPIGNPQLLLSCSALSRSALFLSNPQQISLPLIANARLPSHLTYPATAFTAL